jgi:transposase-like protein
MQTLKEVNDFFKREAELQNIKNEVKRLREDKAELVEALIDMRNHINKRDWDENVSNEAKATFAKATGDK